MLLASIAERLAMELSLLVFTFKACRGWDLNSKSPACGANSLNHCATAAALFELFLLLHTPFTFPVNKNKHALSSKIFSKTFLPSTLKVLERLIELSIGLHVLIGLET